MLEQKTLSNGEVQEFLAKHTISIHVETNQQPDVADKYQIRGVPSVVFLAADGSERGRIEGFSPPDRFLAMARQYTRE